MVFFCGCFLFSMFFFLGGGGVLFGTPAYECGQIDQEMLNRCSVEPSGKGEICILYRIPP